MSDRVAFGRRGGRPSSRSALEPRVVSKTIVEPSAAYADVVGLARAAFRGRVGAATPFDPPILSAPSQPLGDEEAMRAFIGPNWGAYRRLWDRCGPRPSLSRSFGLGAAVFGATWLVYRKLYLWGFGLLAAEVAIAFWAPYWTSVAGLVSRLFIGRYGKSLVLAAGASELERLRRGAGATAAQLPDLRRAGGVNLWLPTLLALAEIWLAIQRTRHPEANLIDPAGLLGQVRDALPRR